MHKIIIILLFLPVAVLTEPPDTSITFSPIGGVLDGASSLSIIPTGDIYIIERNKHRFLVLDNFGNRIDSVGSQGRSDYRFDRPVSINATNGLKIYVSDQNNNRIQMFDRRHQYLTSVTAEKIERQNRFRPAGLTVSPSNELFVYDPDRFLIYKFDTNGNFSREINLRQFGLSHVTQLKMAGSVLLLLDGHNGVVHRFQSDGGYLNFIGGFENTRAISGSDEYIWAVFDDSIKKFTHRGGLIASLPLRRPLSNVSDISVRGSFAYILTSNQLYRSVIE